MSSVAMLCAVASPAFAVVPSLTPVVVALVPQLLVLVFTALLVLVRPRTWFRAAAWAVRHPLHALAGLAAAGGLGWGVTWLFSGGGAASAAAAAAAWEPPKPACGYEGQRGGPGHTYASDSRGAEPVGPNLEPDIRWIRTGAPVRAVSSDGGRVFACCDRAGPDGSTLAAWRVEGGHRLWAVDLPARVAVPPLVPADGSGRVIVVTGGSEPRLRALSAMDGKPMRNESLALEPAGEAAIGDGRLVVAGSCGVAWNSRVAFIPLRDGMAATVRPMSAPGGVFVDGQARAYVVDGWHLECLDLLSVGRPIWRRMLGGAIGAPAWSGGWLYVAHVLAGDAVPEIVCIDPETSGGAVAWRLPLPGLAPDSLLAAGKSRLVVPVSPGGAAALAVVDAIRRVVAQTVPLDAPPAQPVVLADAGDGAAYVLDTKNRVSRIALKAGRVSWTVELGATAYGPMILADGVLLVPTDRGIAVLE